MKAKVWLLSALAFPLFFTCKSANAEVEMGQFINICKESEDICAMMFFSTLDGIKYGSFTNEDYRVGSDTQNKKLFVCWKELNKNNQGYLFEEFYNNLNIEQFTSGPGAKLPVAYVLTFSLKSRYPSCS
ncbi:hypothetical protein [Shewanella psychrotolerans]|uniref:hypothetical protein n=1 Tax=Shewanella psychrotolerans TaxID=2864206 RepID=UPI001C655279|nr:hypothetical protein [Shewanella psychrotolerans]QYK02028.1 hypothetical protein K0I62_03365 [Shewanella psychrotolerans]